MKSRGAMETERFAEPKARGVARLRGFAATGATFLFLLALNSAIQSWLSAAGAEFSSDEASHYVSTAAVHDWLLSGRYLDPMGFALAYHVHYPLIGIGHWGPGYYGVAALWAVVAGTGKSSILLFSASITAALCTVVARLVARRVNWAIGLAAGCALAFAGPVPVSTSLMMLDVPVSLTALLASLAYCAYLEQGRWQYSLAFALLAVLSILIKGNGFALALFVGLAVLLSTRWTLLRSPGFWISLPIVLLLTGPWYWKTYALISPGFRYAWGLGYTSTALSSNLNVLVWALGPLVAALGMIGTVRVLRHRTDFLGIGMLSLTVSVLLFQSLVPAALDSRYMIAAFPGLIVLAADGAAMLAALAQKATVPRTAILAACGVAMIGPASWTLWRAEPLPHWGLIEASQAIRPLVAPTNPVILIVADSALENAALSELCFADPARPSFFAVRGSRLLGGGGYNRSEYEPLYRTVEQVAAAIESYRIPLIMLSTSGKAEWAHVDQVAALVAQDSRWAPVWTSPAGAKANTVIYLRRDLSSVSVDVKSLTDLAAPKRITGPATSE